MPKGAASQAKANSGTGQDLENQFNTEGQGVQSAVLPFLQNELTNPQGYGQPAIQKMETAGGQAVSGAVGAGNEQAQLNAARSGNTAALPGIIAANTRAGIGGQSNNVLNVENQDAQLKQKQQQAGASGLEGLYGEDTTAALNSLGLSNNAIGQWVNADNSNPWLGLAKAGIAAGGNVGAAAVGA